MSLSENERIGLAKTESLDRGASIHRTRYFSPDSYPGPIFCRTLRRKGCTTVRAYDSPRYTERLYLKCPMLLEYFSNVFNRVYIADFNFEKS